MSITINGTTGISGVDGSSTTPAFQGTDTNTGLFYGTDIVGISTGGSERLRVDASGNVGIGTSSPSYKLDVVGGINASSNISTASGNFVLGTNDTYLGFASNNIKFNNTSDRITLNTGAAERMRIDSSGNVLFGKTSTDVTNPGIYFESTNYGRFNFVKSSASGTTATPACRFYYNGSTVGEITNTSTNTAFTTSSDYRLKENIAPMTGALEIVSQLNPVTYTWKVDGSKGQGFIAHELQAVVPDCVTGEKDAIDEEGKPIYQGVDTSFLVATLTAAIQEMKSIIDEQSVTINDLKARVTALEASNV